MARVSCSSRPISVLLPSSTLPAVMKRSTPRSSAAVALRSISPRSVMLEVAFLLAPLHGRFRGLVVHARRASLGDRRQRRFGDDLGRRRRHGFHGAGAADVPYGAEAHRQFFHCFPATRRSVLPPRTQPPVAA